MLDIFGEHRRQLLEIAYNDALNWLASADDLVGTRPTDQYWVRNFAAQAGPVQTETAQRFLSTFLLTIMTRWDNEAVARIIDDLRVKADFQAERDIPVLAETLRNANARKSRQTSAASKICNFVFLTAEVYIWDKLATRSVRHREWLANGSRGRCRAGLYTIKGDHDYPAYYSACRRAFEREMAQTDFMEKAEALTRHVRGISGPLAAPDVPDGFFQRRLLDKLMFHEGRALGDERRKHGQFHDTSAPPSSPKPGESGAAVAL